MSKKSDLTLFFHFLGFWSTNRETFDLYSTALEICHKNYKFDSEIAEIIEVKVGTCKTQNYFFDSVIAHSVSEW